MNIAVIGTGIIGIKTAASWPWMAMRSRCLKDAVPRLERMGAQLRQRTRFG